MLRQTVKWSTLEPIQSLGANESVFLVQYYNKKKRKKDKWKTVFFNLLTKLEENPFYLSTLKIIYIASSYEELQVVSEAIYL